MMKCSRPWLSHAAMRFATAGMVMLVAGSLAACSSSSHTSAPTTNESSSSAAATGSSGSGAAAATGKPIVLFTLAAPQEFPGVGVGMKAAAQAINKAGGVKDPSGGPNRPISIVVCSDLAGSNAAADCGRQAVSDHALAVVGTETGYGPVFNPIVFAAGIPIVAQGAYSTSDLTNKLSFPIANGQGSSLMYPYLGKSLGLKSVYPVVPNLPQATALLPFFKSNNEAAGMTQVGQSLVSASSTSTPDYTPYAAAAASSGAGVIYMDIGPGGVGLMKSLLAQGVNFQKTAVVADSNVISLQDLAPLGGGENGVYFIGNSYPSTYTASPTVAQFNNEMNAYGDTHTPRTEAAEQAWEGVHIVANLIPKLPTISSAALVTAMNNAGPISPGITPPFNWSKPAFTTGFLASLRVFTNEVMVSRVVNGQIIPIVNGFVPDGQTFPISVASGKLQG